LHAQRPAPCLRHTFGTEAAGASVPLPVLQELMGHKAIETTLRYVDVSDRQKQDAIALAFGVRGSHLAAAAGVRRQAPEMKRDPNGI
jgi:integrase